MSFSERIFRMKTTIRAYAKINLFLDMESVREDGYHNIISLMQSVSLCDEVTVEYMPEKEYNITISCSDQRVPCNEKNLAYKAAQIFPLNNGGIHIDIQKSIPMEAGLAGGSADAAATLIALNELTGNMLSKNELMTLGNKLGADVPFCIATGAAIARGTGDILEPVSPMPYLPIVIARDGEGMSTPAAYRALDEKYDYFSEYKPKTAELELLLSENSRYSITEYVRGLFNIFESVVEPCRPRVPELKELLVSHGAIGAMMSGSGTSVFGIFEDEIKAKSALESIKSTGAVAHLCYPL